MKPYRTTAAIAVLLAGALALGGCARQISPDVHEGRTIGETMYTYSGVIESARAVEVQEHDTLEENRTGQLLGGAAGGVAASRAGQGVGKALAIAGGAIVGAVLGSLAEQEIKRQPAMEYVVRTERGDLLTVVQGMSPQLVIGQPVYVQESRGGRSRVIPAV